MPDIYPHRNITEICTRRTRRCEKLEELKQEVNEKIRHLYDRKDQARDKFLDMDDYARQKTEISAMETQLEQLRQNYEPCMAQDDMNLLMEIMPQLSEHLRIARLCKGIGLTIEAIKDCSTAK